MDVQSSWWTWKRSKVVNTQSDNTFPPLVNVVVISMVSIALTFAHAGTSVMAQDQNNVGKQANHSEVESDPYTSTVGYPKRILQIKFPGSELVPKPNADRTDPIVLRIIQSYQHGSDFRYDLEYIGLDPGSYNLSEFLVRKDESEVGELPELRVQINTMLPAGRIEPNGLLTKASGFASYYLPTVVVLGVLWLAGLLFILFWGWSKTRKVIPKSVQISFADRIKPLVEKAMAGELDPQGQAELERMLNDYWRDKLRLRHLSAHELRTELRQHPEASEMLTQLDRWLYDPGESDPVDIQRLLNRYKNTVDSDTRVPDSNGRLTKI
jgi:hypothetical protein